LKAVLPDAVKELTPIMKLSAVKAVKVGETDWKLVLPRTDPLSMK